MYEEFINRHSDNSKEIERISSIFANKLEREGEDPLEYRTYATPTVEEYLRFLKSEFGEKEFSDFIEYYEEEMSDIDEIFNLSEAVAWFISNKEGVDLFSATLLSYKVLASHIAGSNELTKRFNEEYKED